MKIEVLYPELANLYGDLYNIYYLEKIIPNITIYYTNYNDKPRFVDEKIDMVYMGPMMERFQEQIIKKLKPYKKRIKELIDNNVLFLITGNALEIFGEKIDDIKALGIFKTYAKRDFNQHHSSCLLGEFNDLKIVGFKSQFSYSYNNSNPFIKVIKGYGFNDDNNNEGIHYKNFFGTYLIGPILIYNPYFCEYILKLLGVNNKLEFNDTIKKAYEIRLKDFESDYKNFQ